MHDVFRSEFWSPFSTFIFFAFPPRQTSIVVFHISHEARCDKNCLFWLGFASKTWFEIIFSLSSKRAWRRKKGKKCLVMHSSRWKKKYFAMKKLRNVSGFSNLILEKKKKCLRFFVRRGRRGGAWSGLYILLYENLISWCFWKVADSERKVN